MIILSKIFFGLAAAAVIWDLLLFRRMAEGEGGLGGIIVWIALTAYAAAGAGLFLVLGIIFYVWGRRRKNRMKNIESRITK